MDETKIKIRDYPIRLGQFLKLAAVAQDGIEAKFMINNEEVTVNGIIEKRRGRQLNLHDRVQAGGQTFLCV